MNKDNKVLLGLERILSENIESIKCRRVGLICNQASVDHLFNHAVDLFYENLDIELISLFGPQHGIRGDAQDNMIETSHAVDKKTGLPIYSLYSETREPTEEMLKDLDVLVLDLQDVGCRVYTFIYTMANAMKACAKFGKKMVVCDRPNPINGADVEGNLLEEGCESFVGQYPIPMRHGLTIGEIAKLFNDEFSINCELEVIAMDGWRRHYYSDDTNAPWVMPSPNMPTLDTAIVFPATVCFEGTQASEGRGTTRPFEYVGAPYIESEQYAEALNSLDLGGVKFRPVNFIPTFQKHQNIVCGGVFAHVVSRAEFEPVITGLAMIKTLFDMYPEDFRWKTLPYEYVYHRNPFDVIAGTPNIRKALKKGVGINGLRESWQEDIAAFNLIREKYLMYI